MKAHFPQLFQQSVVERAVQLLQSLWVDSISTGAAAPFDMEEVKREARYFLENYRAQQTAPSLPEPLKPISLIEIWLEKAVDDIAAADKLLDRINGEIEHLSKQPALGRDQPQMSSGMMDYPIGDYLLFYREMPDGGIELVRITHGVPASEETYLGKTLRQMLYKDL